MARPIPQSELSKKQSVKDLSPKDSQSLIDATIDSIKSNTSKNLILGTFSGWLAGVSVVRVGRIAAFGLGGGIILLHFATELEYINVNWDKVKEAAGGSQAWMEKILRFVKKNSCFSVVLPAKLITPLAPPEHERALPPDPIPPKPPEPYMPEEPNVFEKPAFFPQKPIPHSPKISPSSIPNPNPSVTTTKQMEPGYPSYGGYLYSIPGYSAFQPVSHSRVVQPSQPPPIQNEPPAPEFIQYPTISQEPLSTPAVEEKSMETDPPKEIQKSQTDFEEHFTPEIVTATSIPDANKTQTTESKMSITSLAQGSGATVTIPSQMSNKEIIKKPERFSLKTSIPISKIDLKYVSNPPDGGFQNSLAKKPFNPAFTKDKPRVEIKSNIVIKSATIEPEVKEAKPSVSPNNSINTLINAAETINKSDNQFVLPEPKTDTPTEVKEPPTLPRPIFNPINIESSKANFTKPPEPSNNEQKNQIVLIQNKNNSNSKMLLTIQQQNPQVLLQRTNFDSKNMQAPSRVSNQSKKSKEDVVNETSSSKVVALKRLHQENCDENDFENLITENQIYGNKIVVKEKSQGTLQEQDLKNKKVTEKVAPTEIKSVVLQPNFLYLSNVQFPANLMMIKNNSKVTQTIDSNKTKIAPNENKVVNGSTTEPNTEANSENKTPTNNATVSKDIQILKSSNNVLPNLPNKSKSELLFQTNQKVIMNSQIVSSIVSYQVPISTIAEGEKVNQTFINPKCIPQKKEFSKPKVDPPKSNDKLDINCPYSKLKSKIVIANIRPKGGKSDEISALDMYEKRKRLRRLKHLAKRESKDGKTDPSKKDIKIEAKKDMKIDTKKDVKPGAKKDVKNGAMNIDKNNSSKVTKITPEKVKNEIYKVIASTKVVQDDVSSGSDTDDYGEEDLKMYEDIIEEYGDQADKEKGKIAFMANLRLVTPEAFKAKDLELQEKVLRNDSVASAYASVGRLDMLLNVSPEEPVDEKVADNEKPATVTIQENGPVLKKKKQFMSTLKLTPVTQQYKEGYEKAWDEVIKERKRRISIIEQEEQELKQAQPSGSLGFDPDCQLRLLTEIKKSVNENNNLIKKRLDLDSNADTNNESIRTLADKNFSELNRLSKMADCSVQLFKKPNTRKRDLNPGFDSENIKKTDIKIEQPYQNYPKIKIPTVSKIISLKSAQECQSATSTQATSMDEPQNSAAGVAEMFQETTNHGNTRDVSCQAEEQTWSDIEALVKKYKEYEAVRRREISDLHKRNTALKIEGAQITRSASRDSDHARALLAERQNLAVEENNLRLSLQRLRQAIEVIRNY